MQDGRCRIWCIHGQFQRPVVWAPFEDRFRGPEATGRARLELEPIDLAAAQVNRGLEGWAREFVEGVARVAGGIPQLLIGYSLGGRLALHSVLLRPELWRAVVIIAADPGSDDVRERQATLERDRAWAQRLRTEPLDVVLAAWDAQPIFNDRLSSLPLAERIIDRGRAAAALVAFSKGHQRPLWAELRRLERPPILYVSGAEDERYRAIGEALAATNSAVEHVVISGAAHRVPWDNPAATVEALQRFFDRHAG